VYTGSQKNLNLAAAHARTSTITCHGYWPLASSRRPSEPGQARLAPHKRSKRLPGAPLICIIWSAFAWRERKEALVQLILSYVVFMILGDIVTYFIGLLVEREFGSRVSLIVFLVLYFASLWVAWLLAVRFTAPKQAQAGAG
jgi:hypothetical protein